MGEEEVLSTGGEEGGVISLVGGSKSVGSFFSGAGTGRKGKATGPGS